MLMSNGGSYMGVHGELKKWGWMGNKKSGGW